MSYSKKNHEVAIAAGRSRRELLIRQCVLAIVILAAALGISSAKAAGEHHPMRFDRLSLEDGLSQSNVLAILQDSEGFLWVGTENGLNRFDGYNFTTYRRERGNPNALPSDFIFDIREGADGTLWIATNGGGLVHMDRASGTFKAYRNDPNDASSLGSDVVRRVFLDTDGSVLAGTRGAGLKRLDPATGRFTQVVLPGNMAANSLDSVFAVHRGADGALWVGGDHGLTRIKGGVGESFDGFEDSVRVIRETSDGTVWVGTYGGGLARRNVDSGQFEFYRHDADNASSLANDEITAILEDGEGRIWVGTNGGLHLVKPDYSGFVRYGNDARDYSSLSDNAVTVLFEDRSGVLWLGTKTRGLNKWNPRTWAYGLEDGRKLSVEGDRAPNVTGFAESAEGQLLVGTFGEGLNVVDRTTGAVTHLRHDAEDPTSLSENFVMSLLGARDGSVWLGTMRSGINRLNPATGEVSERYQFNADDTTSLSANGIMALYEDRQGRIWAGTFGGGISRLDLETKAFTRFRHDPELATSLSGDRVTAFAEDANGRMWIGTDSAGLNLYDPSTGQFHRFAHDPNDPETLSDNTIYSIKIATNGTVWVGTRGGGLDRVIGSAADPDTISFANVSAASGLSNDVIYGIQEDRNQRLWLSTNFGINRYDPATSAIKSLHRTDGLQSEEFNFGAHFANAKGELFFGGGEGYNAFDPNGLPINAHAPAVVLTAIFGGKGGKRLDVGERGDTGPVSGLELTHKNDSVAFEFAALDFSAPEKNEYMYKLEGFNDEWVSLGTRRRVEFTNLDDGSYLLRLRAANSDGVWNEAAFALPVRVLPAPWETWWAYLGYVAMAIQAAFLIWWAHRQKIRREEEYSRRLELAVANRTEALEARNDQLRELNVALQESSLSDPLTGLRNRRFVFEEISRDFEVIRRRNSEIEDGRHREDAADLVFMMVDLDNFKPINDTYGHAAGDTMLLEVRDVLLGTCRRSDFVIRWGGDEFVVIAKQARPEECKALAERIRREIADRKFMLSDGQIVRTTCSIGFAAYPLFKSGKDESGLDHIIGLADALMYEAKKHRNAWAGMLGPNDASTSFDIEEDGLEPTSILFRARRAGAVSVYDDPPRPRLVQGVG